MDAPSRTYIDFGKAWRREHGIPVVGVFDGFRAIAILSIAVWHCLTTGAGVALEDSVLATVLWGPAGITALFIVSGFVVYLPTVARGGDFGSVAHYGLRRAARILPAYWVALGLATVLLLAVSEPLPTASTYAYHVSLLQTPVGLFFGDFQIGFELLTPVWTLSLEGICYVLLPLIAGWWLRRPFIGVAASVAVMLVWWVVVDNAHGLASTFGISLGPEFDPRVDNYYASQFPVLAFAFACGMAGAVVYVRLRARGLAHTARERAALVAVASGAAMLVFVYLGIDLFEDDQTGASILVTLGQTISMTVMFVALSVAPRAFQRPFANRPIRWLGDVSYGIYLIHNAVLWLVLHEFSLAQDGSLSAALVWISAVIPVSIAYGYLSARFVERPIRAWAHRFGRRRVDGRSADGRDGAPSRFQQTVDSTPSSSSTGAGQTS